MMSSSCAGIAQGLEVLVVDLRHQLASAVSSRNSQHSSAEGADEAAEDLAVQVRAVTSLCRCMYVTCMLPPCLGGFQVEGVFVSSVTSLSRVTARLQRLYTCAGSRKQAFHLLHSDAD